MPQNFALDLTPDETKQQRALRKKIIAAADGKAHPLGELRKRAGVTYDELALALDAPERTSVAHYCLSSRRPLYEYAVHIEKVLKGAVTVELLMAGGPRKRNNKTAAR